MKTIEDEIKFHLSKSGWYLGDSKIRFVKEKFKDMNIEESFSFIDAAQGAWTEGKDIKIHTSLGWIASLPQLDLISYHEHFHKVLGHCNDMNPLLSLESHRREYECDARALKQMIDSQDYNRKELYDAIAYFGEVVDQEESERYPSSKNRHKRLLNQLKGCGL